MKAKILSILKNSDSFVSGQSLCDQLQVSRTAIWKVMNKLKAEGYEIESVSNKGYRLCHAPDIFSKEELESTISTKWAGQELYFLGETESTNNDAKAYLEKDGAHGLLVVARKQLNGKGRRGRNWISDSEDAVYLTIGLRPDIMPDKASMLTVVMALAVTRALNDLTDLEIGIKWPNDLVVNGKKISGMLTELTLEEAYIQSVVIGVGVNCNQKVFDDELGGHATSIYLEQGKEISKTKLIAKITECFEKLYDQFILCENLEFMRDEYNSFLANYNREVKVLDPNNEFQGIARGIDSQGELLVEKEDGTLVNVYAGEVSVRGIYGYV